MPYRAFRQNLTVSFFTHFIIALTVLGSVVLWRIQNQASLAGWVEHSDQVILGVKDAELALRDVQLSYRGYLITPDPRYLTDLATTQRSFENNLVELAALIADNPDQQQRLHKISILEKTWAKSIGSLVGQKNSGVFSPELFSQVRSQAQSVYGSLEDFVAAERRLRTERARRQARQYRIIFLLIPGLSAIVMIFLGFWGWHQIQVSTKRFREALDTSELARREAEGARVEAEAARAEAEKERAKSERANRAKDNFLGTVSHELRNPLNSIMLWSSSLLRGPASDETIRRGLTAIDRAVRAQAHLIEDLLDITRIESGRMRLDVQMVDLADVVRAGIEGMRAAAEAKSIALQEIIDPSVASIAGDPGRLQQVVWNLVSNAVKFTPKGGKIQIRLERINSHIEISVADTGQGIEPAALDSVFERFWQADGSGESKHGVGLGLSIVKEIVSLHGGTVAAHSDGPGKGSTFTVRLQVPISTVPLLEPRRHPTVGRMSSIAQAPRLDGFSILVVDDDQDACEALRNLLGSLGADVTAVTSARGALSLMDRLRPDAVISDIGMPVEDGYFLARELRQRERESGGDDVRIPLVALTAYGRVEDKIQILMAGFDSHTIKPVDPVELSTVLVTLLAGSKPTLS
jgi:signal transduction histidine kinase/ActR/RegA family two-component response regulator